MFTASVTQKGVTAATAMFALALTGASVGSACSPFQPRTEVRGEAGGAQTSGPAGSDLIFTGRDFAPGAQVEVRWNSRTGQLLGEGWGPSFSVPIRIPETAAVGVHYIMAFPTVGATATMAFEVTRSPSASPKPGGPAPGDSPASGSTGTASTASGDDERSTAAHSAGYRLDDSSTATSVGDNSGSGSSAGSTATESRSTASATNRSEPAEAVTNEATTPAEGAARARSGESPSTAATERQAALAASANPAVVTTPDGHAVFGGSTASPSTATPSAATVSGDTWSAFAAGTKPSLTTDALATSSSDATPAPGVGIGLLGAGLVSLLAGFAAAESARKRALAAAGSR